MFKVMTWNVENLFRSGADDGPESQDVYETKLQGLAATINTQAPDAVGLQEVGDPDALSDLVAQLDGDWHRRVSSHEDGRGIRVAWISPRSITEPENVINFPAGLQPVQVDDAGTTTEEMGRGAVAITVPSDSGRPVRLLTAHLKSKLLTFPAVGSRRVTKVSARGSRPTPSIAARLRRPRCGSGPWQRSGTWAEIGRSS